MTVAGDLPITELQVSALTIPPDRPETDGTLAWDSTTAISAVDIVAHGSRGFTSFDTSELVEQLASWAEEGFQAVKMKAGRGIDHDAARAGEYAAIADDLRLLASDSCIDVLQADAKRCGGPDGFLLTAYLAEAFKATAPAEAFLRRQPRRAAITSTLFRDKISELKA